MKLALIGYGVVGQGLTRILRDQNLDMQIVAAVTHSRGMLYHPDGLDFDALLATMKDHNHLSQYPDQAGLVREMDTTELIATCNADVIVEISYTDIATGEPAMTYTRTALENGKHVVTANKGPAALHYAELKALADSQGLHLGIEATVMSGTPTLHLGLNDLAGNHITSIRGILNGTTNYILTGMEAGRSYEDVLEEAQKLGYAEADPTADVEGHDALAKVVILANAVMGANLDISDVPCQGISHLTLEDIEQAKQNNARWKLIGAIQRKGDQVTASVEPVMLPLTHPLANVNGVTNAITYSTQLMGDVTLIGAGAGNIATGFGLLTDLLDILWQRF